MTAPASRPLVETASVAELVGQGEAPRPRPVENAALAALQLLLRVEAEVRETANLRELRILMANETRKLTRARQIFVVEFSARQRPKVVAVSSAPATEPNAPLNQSVEKLITSLANDAGLDDIVELRAEAYKDQSIGMFENYPLRELLWLPLKTNTGKVFAGLLQARDIPWTERDQIVSQRLAKTYAHAWCALTGLRDPRQKRLTARRLTFAAIAAIGLALIIPVPMSALAPAEIVAQSPTVVTAPIDGVVDNVLVDPNTTVAAGQPLFSFVDTKLRNDFEVADRQVNVAQAKLKRANQLAFQDMRGRHELGIARAELALRVAERDYARDLLDKTVVRADRPGIAMFRDKKDMVGKPVTVGERLMELADPQQIALRIDMPVVDGQLLKPNADTKVFLDSQPLTPINGRIIQADYQARPVDGSGMAFRALARLDNDGRALPRLGVRGTAQVYGENVPLALYLFRRPLTAVRQWLGL